MRDFNGQDYGKCPYCNADRVLNPKTGKIFCQAKCWLKRPQRQYSAPGGTKPPQVDNLKNAELKRIADALEAIEKKLPLYANIDGKDERVPF
jgi:hypothetical protein